MSFCQPQSIDSTTSSELVKYDGLILTTIELIGSTNRVSFTEDGKNSSSEKAVFLKNIEEVEDGVFEADRVSVEEAAKTAKGKDGTTLFCVHGFNVEPGSKLNNVLNMLKSFEEKNPCFPVPVIWPSEGSVFSYSKDREIAQKAGQILKTLTENIKNDFGNISLMCHSMGNHLLLQSAGTPEDVAQREDVDAPDVKFENNEDTPAEGTPNAVKFQNIFMVAADVPADIFTEKPRETYYNNEPIKAAGNLTKMLATGGKIYVLYNGRDRALIGSKFLKWFNFGRDRLGASGAYQILPEFKGKVMNVDTREKVDMTAKFDGFFNYKHSYHYEPWAMDFYLDPEKELNHGLRKEDPE